AAERLERAAGERPEDAEAALARARALRSALYRTFRAEIEGRAPLAEDVERLAGERRALSRGEALVEAGAGLRLEWRSEVSALEALLWPPLRSAVALLTDPEALARVRRCAGEACGWLFYDTPRGLPRRWCYIRDCGNVAKVRAYRERERDG
ncbi:MAG TPA: CGNR zinc finger domain-containing protein, partial [Gemmatimonadota bacterium]|nr:CGNR zinc finger domain-containing protein [Gemmatimonadota bacterium]